MKPLKFFFILSLINFVLICLIALIPNTTPNTPIVSPVIPTSTSTPTPKTIRAIAPTQAVVPTQTSTPTPDPRCIITINGVRYDVTAFSQMHSGGDVFQCGTDMSTVFNQRHSNRELQMMQQYKI